MNSFKKHDFVKTPDGWYGYVEEVHAKGKSLHIVCIGYEPKAPRSKTFPSNKLTGPFTRAEADRLAPQYPKAA